MKNYIFQVDKYIFNLEGLVIIITIIRMANRFHRISLVKIETI